MWNVVTQITTGVGLAAFFVAAAVYAYSFRFRSRIDSIKSVPSKDRADLLRRELNQFGIEAKNLSAEQQYSLALKELEIRHTKNLTASALIGVLAVMCGVVAIFGIWLSARGELATQNSHGGLPFSNDTAIKKAPVKTEPEPLAPIQSPSSHASLDKPSLSIQPGPGDPARLIARELAAEFERAGFVLDPNRPTLIYSVEVEARTVGRSLDGPDRVTVKIEKRWTDPTRDMKTQPIQGEYDWYNPNSSARNVAQKLYELLLPSLRG